MINTHEELLQKIKEYESKWGKLGHTNIMQPELKHTGLKGGSKMLKMDNEYYEFRRKVAEGSKKNKLAHASTISPDELNERYEQELVDRGSLIHTSSPLAGSQRENAKYYKREGEPGHYRYYYTKEEWDAAHRSPESSENKANAHKQNIAPAQEPAKDTKNFIHNAQADSVKKYAEIAKKSPKAAAEEIVKNNDMGLEDMFHEIEEAFKSGSIKWNKDNLVPGENGDDEFVKAKEWIEEASIAAEKFCKDIDKSAGTGGDTFKAVRDLVKGRVNEMAEKYATKPMDKKVTKDNIKHSADESSAITSSAMGDEIIDEYKAFQEKVKAGAERHRLTHSSFISPEELNAKYQEELENNRILCHASNGQNYGYYQKIEKYYPDGSTRYFYTKEQWDAYQKNLELTNKAKEKEKIDKQKKESYEKNKAAAEAQKKAESDKWDTHKKIREDFHQVPGYMTYSSTFVDDMKATPEGSDKGKEFLFNAMKDAYKKYPAIENIRTDAPKYNNVKPKDSEVFGFMDEVQKGIDKYTKDFIKKYQLPEDEYTPLINNYFLNMADQLMKDNKLDYNYVQDVYYRNSDLGKKEAKKEEILKQGDFKDRIFREDYKNKWNIYNEIFDKDYDRDSEVYKVNLQNFADNGPESKYLKETIESLKKRRTNDGKPQYSDEDIYNAAYTFLWKNFQKQAVDSNYAFSPSLRNLVPDILKAMGYDGEYTADWNDLIIKLK